MFPRCILIALFLHPLILHAEPQEREFAIVHKWLDSQAKATTFYGEFTQTRTFRTLLKPLKTTGKLWFQRPDQFRWQTGDPIQQIAAKNAKGQITLYTPRKHQFEILDPETMATRKPGFLSFLEAGFPKDLVTLKKHFALKGAHAIGKGYAVEWKPLDRKMAVAVRKIVFSLDAQYQLTSFELFFRNQSTITCAFTKMQINPPLDPALFSPTREDR